MNSKQYFVFSYVHDDASKLIDHFSTSFLSLWIPLFMYPMYQQWFLQYKRFTLEKKIIKLKYMLSSFLAMVKHGSYNIIITLKYTCINDLFLHINYQIARIYHIFLTCHELCFLADPVDSGHSHSYQYSKWCVQELWDETCSILVNSSFSSFSSTERVNLRFICNNIL